MNQAYPFNLSSPKGFLLLLVIYLAVVIDVVMGLNLNLFGYGREPLWFAIGTVAVALLLYALRGGVLGMIALVLCCIWLASYPTKNGFDVVLSPMLFIGFAIWFWQKKKHKK